MFAEVSRALPATVIAADLKVFDANGVALDSRDSLAHINGKVILTVQVPQCAVVTDVRANLNRGTEELNYLLNKDPARYGLLQSPAFDVCRSASDPYKCSISDQVCDANCH